MVSFATRARRLRAMFVFTLLASVLVALPATTAAAATSVFINEIHYDNDGADADEFVEIAGPAGTDLSGWTVVLYNGSSTQLNVYDTIALAGLISDQDAGFGTLSFQRAGIQNGSPDGLALVDGSTVVQFLSYEGSFTAVDGPAAGMASTDIGVSEPGTTTPGDSLQLTGTGSMYEDFTWTGPIPNTEGAVNTGQSFGGTPTPPEMVINEIDYDQAGTDAAEFLELKNVGTSSANLDGWSVVLVNGNGGAIYDTIDLTGVTVAAGDYLVICANAATVANCDIDDGPDTNFIQNGAPDAAGLLDGEGNLVDAVSYEGDTAGYTEGSGVGLEDDPAIDNSGISRFPDGSDTDQNNVDLSPRCATPGAENTSETTDCVPPPAVVINEIDYDQAGTDTAEFLELKNTGGEAVDLSGWTVELVNGTGGGAAIYQTIALPAVSLAGGDYFVVCGNAANTPECDLDVTPDSNLIQNGAPDAVGLRDAGGVLVDAVSYEGDTGAPYTEGSGAGLEDDPGIDYSGISRLPDGIDTDQNNVDLSQRCSTPGAENTSSTTDCVSAPPLSCDATYAFTPIHDIQGSGTSTPIPGVEVYVEAVVVGDFQASNTDGTDLAGFYVQEEDEQADADPLTSEGVFVFDLLLSPGVPVAQGDLVRIRGFAGEFQDQTQVSVAGGEVVVCGSDQGGLVTATPIPFPLAGGQADLERYEGMAVTTNQPMTVIEYFNLDRFGVVDVATERLETPTDAVDPGAPAAALLAYNEQRRIRLDDGSQDQNPYPVKLPDGELDFADAFGGGDTLSNIQGVLSWIRPRVGGFPDRYAIQLTALPDFADTNPRPETPPSVGGSVQVAGFNVLNYFNGDGMGGGFPTPRGAFSPEEFVKQTAKIVSAITALDADVVGLTEIENDFADGPNSAIADLVDALNAVAGAGTYAYIDPGANVGSDAITVAVIYQPASVTPIGGLAILDDAAFVNPFGTQDDRNRPAMAQTFMEVASGEYFTAVVNHFKSKSGSEIDDPGAVCNDGDPSNDIPDCDQGDGQGYFNATRVAAAEALVDWLSTQPTGTTDPDYVLVGDYNSYAQEDPIEVLEAAGYVDLLEAFQPSDVYTYVFDGQTGYLDYGFASSSLVSQVTGAAPWNINADEPDAFDYSEAFDNPANILLWYSPEAYRSSDHDPVLVGLGLDAVDGVATATPDTLWPPNHKYRTVTVTAIDAGGNALSVHIVEVTSSEADSGLDPEDVPNDIVVTGPDMVNLRAERFALEGRTYTITALVTSTAGQTQLVMTTVFVPHDQGK